MIVKIVKNIPGALFCCLLVLSLVISGCTSSGGSADSPGSGSDNGGISGTYKNIDDSAVTYTLNTDGTFQYSNGVTGFAGTYSIVGGELKLCTKDTDGSSCFSVPMQADGSFIYGYNTFRK